MLAVALVAAAAQMTTTADFDAEWARLKRGRTYSRAKTGQIAYRIPIRSVPFDTVVDIPETYDPARRWPVRVQLHGGVSRPLENERPRRPNALLGSIPQIYVYPRGWSDAMWWQESQIENVRAVLARLKEEYNVDESLVYIGGFSDGATGAFYFGMRDPTPFSAILPLHGNILVLANPSTHVEGQMYLGNLANRPMFATNGGRDPLYPAARMAPLVDLMKEAGAEVEYLPLPEVGHEMSWWPARRDRIEQFLDSHRRQPHPARLSWETERTDRFNRVDWLVIDALGVTASNKPLQDQGAGLFPRKRPSGRVDIVRKGNTFEAETRGVKVFTLLLSPDVVDFARPVRVTVNGRVAVERTVAKDPAVLLKWASRDDDREVLYGAELEVEVK